MSGNNPHRLGQPNASFNLQVPFIPRQPQLAHVHMNDSILRSSPLNWHQSDAAFLNYMSTQHKTSLDLNPFVRPPVANSFGTVDLSFPAHHRHTSTPSPHNINNTAMPSSVTPPLEFPPPFSSKSMLNSSTALLPSPNSLKDITSNGTEKLTSLETMTPSNLTTGLFVAHHLHDATKNSGWNSSTTHNNEPIELIKEKLLKNFQELIERNATTTDPSTLLNPAASTFVGLPPHSSINNNTSAQRLVEFPSPNHANTSNSHNTSRDSQTTTSNDDSVDSNVGKKRRRRKPNKTCRLQNNDNGTDDDDGTASKHDKLSGVATVNQLPVDVRLSNIGSEAINNGSTVVNASSATASSKCENQLVEPLRASLESPRTVTNAENGDGTSKGSAATDSRPVEFSSPMTRKRRSVSRLSSPNEASQDNNSNSCSNSPNQRGRGKRKLEIDTDCETIDKIAAMIASTEFNPKNGHSTPVPTSLNVPVTLENGNSKDIFEVSETPAQPVDQKDRRFEDVEIKLEEMFAGIDDDVDQTKVKSTKLEGCKEVRVAIESLGSLESIVPKTEKKKKGRPKMNKDAATTSVASEETDQKAKKPTKRLPKTKTKKGKGKKATNKPVKGNCSTSATDNKKSKIKEETMDTTSKFRGPFIHVKVDGSSGVVNAPITEEIAENKAKVKKTFTNQNHNDRSKIRGLHVSTLSMKYDASTTDKSWMCVFCKMGPHKGGLGDLFGPYILSTTCEDFELSQVDPADDAFKSKKTKANTIQKRTLPSVAVGASAATTGHKRKRKAIEPIPSTSTNSSINSQSSSTSRDVVDIFEGMTKTTDTSYEVWVHGDCAVWSNGVYLIGPRIVGLDAAVWGSTRYRCNGCQNYGAMLSCFKRGCDGVAHVPCARKAKWNLCDENFKILCDKHSDSADRSETVQQT